MEIRKTWTRSICFSVENHVHISKCLAVVERYWNLQVTWQRDDHCGDAFVFFVFLSCLEKMHVSTCSQTERELFWVFSSNDKQKKNKSSVVIFFYFFWQMLNMCFDSRYESLPCSSSSSL
jgi:hypothetical protein